jgi:hypothetical protein
LTAVVFKLTRKEWMQIAEETPNELNEQLLI